MEQMICDCNIIHEDKVKKALKNKPKKDQLDKLSTLFKIIGDQTRIQILWLLDNNEMCVCDIANVLNMTKSAISHQLATLKQNGVVKSIKRGKEVYYSFKDDHITSLYEIGIKHIEESKNENI